jgi:hypothetical protein
VNKLWDSISGGIIWLWLRRPRIVFDNRPSMRLLFVNNERESFYNIVQRDSELVMLLEASWYVTNIGRPPCRILSTRVVMPQRVAERPPIAYISETLKPGAALELEWPVIDNHDTVSLTVTTALKPVPSDRLGRPLKVKIAVVDQFQNLHRSPVVWLRCRGKR